METEDPREQVRRIVNAACEASGLPSQELVRLAKVAGWGVMQLEAELDAEGWLERLRAAAQTRETEFRKRAQETIAEAIGECLSDGPIAMAQLDESKARDKIHPDLLAALDDPDLGSCSMLVTGPTRVGKSLFAVLVAKCLLRRHIEQTTERKLLAGEPWMGSNYRGAVVWARAFGLVNARRQHPLGKGECEEVTRAVNCGVLILDDIGWANGDATIREILAVRYDRKKPTIATAGDRLGRLYELVGESVVRRMIDPEGVLIDLFEAERGAA